jgi:hypothetical protein
LICDTDRTIGTAYGANADPAKGAARVGVIIDKDGKIKEWHARRGCPRVAGRGREDAVADARVARGSSAVRLGPRATPGGWSRHAIGDQFTDRMLTACAEEVRSRL